MPSFHCLTRYCAQEIHLAVSKWPWQTYKSKILTIPGTSLFTDFGQQNEKAYHFKYICP